MGGYLRQKFVVAAQIMSASITGAESGVHSNIIHSCLSSVLAICHSIGFINTGVSFSRSSKLCFINMSSQRATNALLFMQQCRQKALTQHQSQPRTRTISTSLDPNSFGKKMRIPISISNSSSSKKSNPSPPSQAIEEAERQFRSAPTEEADFPRSRSTPILRYRHNPAIKPGLFSFIKYRVLRLKEPPNPHDFAQPPFNVLTNPYRARKNWPPILSQMSESEQFHYEKKFRRRLLNKTYAMRSGWDMWTLVARRTLIGVVVVYYAFVHDSDDPNAHLPSDGLRYWIYGMLLKGSVWPQRARDWLEKQYSFYKIKHKEQWDPYNHGGWDETRGRNTLPGAAAPPSQRPLLTVD